MDIEEVFVRILNMSLTASYVILAVIVLRLLLKKTPKWIICILWCTAAFRLVFPFSLENVLSVFSVIPASDIVTREILYSQTPTIHSGISVLNSTVNPVISESMAPSAGASVNPMQVAAYIAAIVWLVGVSVLFIYSTFSYAKLKINIITATKYKDNIYQSERISSPFMLGIIKPKVYIPYTLKEPELSHVLRHENAHIIRRDYIVKALAFIILMIHWFNPLVWIAYILFSRDIEYACDEKVIKNMSVDQRKSYSEALLSLAIKKGGLKACPLAFGETTVKERVKKALSYKKPALWIIIATFVACAVTAVCLLTDPISNKKTDHSYEANNLEQIRDISQYYGTYHPSEVIYVNPLSSFYPFELDYTPYYTLEKSEFTIITPDDDSSAVIVDMAPLYERSKITEEEFVALFSIDFGMPDVSGYKNIEQITLTNEYSLFILDDDLWIADFNGENVWIIYKLQVSEQFSSKMEEESKMLTLDSLINLVEEKGDKLTWSDFGEYEHYDIGSGLYIWQIPINESFCVIINGTGPKTEPMFVRLAGLTLDGQITDYSLDLREDNVDIRSFIDGFSDDLRQLKWTYMPHISSVFPALPISIDMDYSTVEAETDNGSLYIHEKNITENLGSTYSYEYGEKIWWSPLSEGSYETADELLAATEDECLLKLKTKDAQGGIICICQINVKRISDESELYNIEYSVALADGYNSELALNRSFDSRLGFVISFK